MLIQKLIWPFKKIPVIIIGAFTVIGILITGFLFGILFADQSITDNRLLTEAQLRVDNQNLRNIITGYEELAMLYYKQGENLSVVLDVKTLESDPQKAYDAFSKLDTFRDQINIQLGKIFQLRKAANLPETSSEFQY